MPRFCVRRAAFVLLAAAAAAGCGSGPAASSASNPAIALRPPDGHQPAYIEVTGVAPASLSRLRGSRLTDAEWHSLLKITVGPGPSELPPIEGRYAADASAITFVPLFPFDRGREYFVVFDDTHVPGAAPPRTRGALTRVVSLEAIARNPSTTVTAVYPSADVLPENTLRLYIEFSAPMANTAPAGLVKLLDERGVEVPIPFLPVEAALWNGDHTRYTLFFDPGRVKQGILPNRELGRPLRAGRRYTLEVSGGWRDAQGLPLAAPYRRTFRIGPTDARPLTLSTWRLSTPAPGTREALVVTFPAPLDHGLAARAIGVEAEGGRGVDGVVGLEAADTRWVFRPAAAWEAGKYHLVALSILEDPAGNQIGRPFEVDMKRPPPEVDPDAYRLPFRIGESGS